MKRAVPVLAASITGLVLGLAVVPAQAQTFKVTSSELTEGGRLSTQHILNTFGCQGGNRSPQLSWEGAPPGTRSFVLTLYDPDAPTGSGWWHWVVFNIPATATALPAGAGDENSTALPPGAVQSRTDFGKPGYGGACPPQGRNHRYTFTVHALKVEKLHLPADASAALVGFMTNTNSLGKATLNVTYGR